MHETGQQQGPGHRKDDRLQVRAPAPLLAELRRLAAVNQRSAAGEARFAISEHVRRQRRAERGVEG